MRIAGVIDVRGGLAVHARGGVREQYAPVERAGGYRIDGDARALARFYRDEYGLRDVYVADLDAIAGASVQRHVVHALAGLHLDVHVDAAVTTASAARSLLDAGAARVIVGLETLPDFAALAAICAAVDPDAVMFSLDMRHGRPLMVAAAPPCHSAELIAAQAVSAGVRDLILLDLSRVGTAAGIDADAPGRLASRVPECRVWAGGGIASCADLVRLQQAGVAGALMATALIDRRIAPSDLHASATR